MEELVFMHHLNSFSHLKFAEEEQNFCKTIYSCNFKLYLDQNATLIKEHLQIYEQFLKGSEIA